MVKKGKKQNNVVPNTFFGKITHSLSSLNNSKFFAGLVMIMLNIGSKYITVRLTKSQEAYLGGTIARQLLIFSVIWSKRLMILLLKS